MVILLKINSWTTLWRHLGIRLKKWSITHLGKKPKLKRQYLVLTCIYNQDTSKTTWFHEKIIKTSSQRFRIWRQTPEFNHGAISENVTWQKFITFQGSVFALKWELNNKTTLNRVTWQNFIVMSLNNNSCLILIKNNIFHCYLMPEYLGAWFGAKAATFIPKQVEKWNLTEILVKRVRKEFRGGSKNTSLKQTPA